MSIRILIVIATLLFSGTLLATGGGPDPWVWIQSHSFEECGESEGLLLDADEFSFTFLASQCLKQKIP